MTVKKKVQVRKNSKESDAVTAGATGNSATSARATKKKAVTKKAPAAAKKKVARKKSAPAAKKKAARKSPAGTASAAAMTKTNSAKPLISREERQRMVGEAAYLISLKRHPDQGSPDSDWLSAETVIDMIFDVAD